MLEKSYLKQFIGSVVEVLPETVYEHGIIGHTGNYLLVKIPTDNQDLQQTRLITIQSIEYPYCYGFGDVEDLVTL